MKFSLLTAIAAGAALTQVGANPLRVLIATEDRPAPSFRFGHAVSKSNVNFNPNVATIAPVRSPCIGSRLRNKANEVSAAFRKALGLPPATAEAEPVYRIQVLPHRIVDLNPPADRYASPPFVPSPYLPHPRPHVEPQHAGHYRLRQRLRNAPFTERLHVALMALGPWEGRAVAFVLGLGIGVLLRMIYVLFVVTYRFIKGPKKDENEYSEIFVVEEYEVPEEIVPVLPAYTDQKTDKEEASV